MGHNSPDYIHTLAEAFKLSFADREEYYGDPNHIKVPLSRLLSDEYAAEREATAVLKLPAHRHIIKYHAVYKIVTKN